MKEIKIKVGQGENFTPASLMQRYAKQTPGVVFSRDYWSNAELTIEGRCYHYHHWGITAEKGETVVMLYLEEVRKPALKIWFFEADPETGHIKAGYTVNGKRHVSLVWSQAGSLYVRTGAKITGDLQRHDFSAAQSEAYRAFVAGKGWSVEFEEGI